MAFTGTATIKSLGKYKVRITGVTLNGNGTAGTIGPAGDTGAELQVPASFPAALDDAAVAQGLDWHDIIEVMVNQAPGQGQAHAHDDIALNPAAGVPWRLTIQNDGGQASQNLDIRITYAHSRTR